MNKSELVEAISKTTSLAKRDAENAVNALVHTVVSEVKAGRRVAVVGFGAFRPTRRAARMGRNPQTGASVRIPASKGVSFTASSTFKDIVNGRSPLGAPKVVTTGAARPAAASGTKRAAATKATATRAAAKKAPAKKAPAAKAAVKKAPVKKAAVKKAPVKKAAVKKAAVKKAPVKKAVAKKAPARRVAAARVPARKAPAAKRR